MLRKTLFAFFVCSLVAGQALAQNWSFDARKVALGSPGSGENLASRMIDEESDYRAIVLPFGLFQVFRDFDRLNPTKDNFDVIRTMEYAASPLHYTFGRDSVTAGQGNGRHRRLSRPLRAAGWTLRSRRRLRRGELQLPPRIPLRGREPRVAARHRPCRPADRQPVPSLPARRHARQRDGRNRTRARL